MEVNNEGYKTITALTHAQMQNLISMGTIALSEVVPIRWTAE